MVVVPLYAENDDPRKDGGIVERLKFCSGNVHLKTSLPLTNIRELTNPKIPDSAGNLKSVVVEYLSPPQEWQKELCEIMILGSATTLQKLKFGCVSAGDFPAFGGQVFRKLKKLDINYGQLPVKPCRARISRAITESLWATPSSSIPSLSPYLVSGAWPDHYFGEPSVSVAIALILASTPSSPQSRTTSTRLRITLVVDARLTSKLSKVLGR
ncbi:hypothetical protein Fcan01_19099 [Folsomia candida]|uniref:Uncharacterized protein n=1 Tax=Folsomia candida TaxID=158441 RepID=A0A226DMS5_FOLCA|nr:hypothetical protein Fcan01_19099 [Folsomia candida]